MTEFKRSVGGPSYYGRTIEGLGMTSEHLDAIRFCRKQDAEAVIEDNGWTEVSAVEHQWDDGRPDYLRLADYDLGAGRILRGHTKVGCLCRYCKAVLSRQIILKDEEQ